MFLNFQIRNFRTFQSLKVDGLQKVNLITGRNGTGKTAFLEGIFLNTGATNTRLCISLANFRGTTFFTPTDDSLFRNLFHRLSFAYPIELIGEWRARGQSATTRRNLSIHPITARQAVSATSVTKEVVSGLEFSYRGGSTKSRAKIQWLEENVEIPLGDTGASAPWTTAEPSIDQIDISPSGQPELPLPAGEGRRIRQSVRLSSENPQTTALVYAIFVLARYYNIAAQIYQQLVNAVKQKLLHDIVQIMRIVDPRVLNIVPLAEKGREGIYIDIGDATLLPLSIMGAGFFNSLNIAAAAASTLDGGVLLIDEIEDGIHYSAFPSLAEAILRIAERKEMQVFITTHSGEIVNAFGEAAKRLKFQSISALRFVRGDKDSDRIRVSSLTLEDLVAAQDIDLELR